MSDVFDKKRRICEKYEKVYEKIWYLLLLFVHLYLKMIRKYRYKCKFL